MRAQQRAPAFSYTPVTGRRAQETRFFLPYADRETTSSISAKAGFAQQRQKGSHLILDHPSRRVLVIPAHKGGIPRGIFLKILKDAGFTEDDFSKG